MRIAFPLLLLIALPACSREKDFDTEFAETRAKLQAESKHLDKEMAKAKATEPGKKVPLKTNN